MSKIQWDKPDYNWVKTSKKVGYGIGYIFVCGLLYLATDRAEVAFLVPVFIGLQNYLKHKLSWEWL